jgi:hypothetical protein
MAKRSGETTLENFAEDLGKLLGTAETKARGWLDQRKNIAKQLTAVRDKADELLRELTGGAAKMAAAVNQARTSAKKGRKRGRKNPMTAAERKAVSERMRKYWADRRGTKARKTAKKTAKKKAADSGGSSVGNG